MKLFIIFQIIAAVAGFAITGTTMYDVERTAQPLTRQIASNAQLLEFQRILKIWKQRRAESRRRPRAIRNKTKNLKNRFL